MNVALRSNIWKYGLILIANKRVFTAMVGAYYLTIPGVTPFWIGMFLLAGSGASFIFDIPSSYFADKIGHKEAIVISRGFMIVSSIIYLLPTNIWGLIVASIFMSMGVAFLSGVGSAFMHETLRGLDRENDYRTVMGKISSLGFFIPAILATVVPFTVQWGYKIPFIIGLGLDVMGLVAALLLVRPRVHEHAVESDVNYVDVVRQGFALRFFRIGIFSGVVSALLLSVDTFRSPYQTSLGLPVILFGVFFGIGRAIASILLANSGRLHRIIGDIHAFQRLQILVYGVLLLVLGLNANPWVVVVVFVLDNALKYGLSQVSGGYKLDIIRDHKYKATLLSTAGQVEDVLTMIGVGLMGLAIEHWGYRPAFLTYAIIFIVSTISLNIWIKRNPPINYATSGTN